MDQFDIRLQIRMQQFRDTVFPMGRVAMLEHPDQPITDAPLETLFQATPTQLARHQVVMGTTGAGKSKYLELFSRHLIDHHCGFTFIDPHGDTLKT